MRKSTKKIMYLLLAAALLFTGSAAYALPASPQSVLSMGDYGSEVSSLQTELKAIGFYKGGITGLFDEETRMAVETLQTLLSVKCDGKFGPLTYRSYVAALEGKLITPVYMESDKEASSDVLKGKVIGIDAGHQSACDNVLEAVSPRGSFLKPRMSGGATGVKTGAQEAVINLQIALKLQAMLTDAGATVVMTRQTQDVSLSNKERAVLMNQSGVDVWLRLHCDASTNASTSGASVLLPSAVETPAIYVQSVYLATSVLNGFCSSTGAKNLGLLSLDNQTGFNWSERPVIALEMGQLSNVTDDVRLNRDSYQTNCAQGMFDGLVEYFAGIDAYSAG